MIQEWIAESRVRIEQARLLVLKTAWLMDTVGNKGAHTEIQAIKIVTPAMAQWVIDRAIQAHGGGRRQSRTSRWPACGPAPARCGFADGPDEVHKRSLARRELRKPPPERQEASARCPDQLSAGTGGTRPVRELKERNIVQRRSPIVTGAARGIGAAAARQLAADGMAVAVLDLDEAAWQGHRRTRSPTRAAGRSRSAPT